MGAWGRGSHAVSLLFIYLSPQSSSVHFSPHRLCTVHLDLVIETDNAGVKIYIML